MTEYADLKELLKAEGEPISYEAADAIEALERDVETLSELNVDWSQQVVELINRAEQAERERDAAVADNAALLELAQHPAECDSMLSWQSGPCNCPLAADHPGDALLARMARLENHKDVLATGLQQSEAARVHGLSEYVALERERDDWRAEALRLGKIEGALLARMARLEAVAAGAPASLSGAATLNARHEGYTT